MKRATRRRRVEAAIDAVMTVLSIADIVVVVCYAGYIIGTLV